MSVKTTLPTDSNERKDYALFRGCLRYFPAALAGVSKTSKLGNDKHNPGQEMHHARNKSQDHGDCIIRHLLDVDDLMAAKERGESLQEELILNEVSSMAWRALALSQELHEKFGSPLAPGAKTELQEGEKAINLKFPKTNFSEQVDDITYILKSRKQFEIGDIVKHVSNDVEVTVEGTFFDEKGTPVLFVKDADNKIYGVDPSFYKGIYVNTNKEAK